MKTVSYYSLSKKRQQNFFKYLSEIKDSSPAFENMWNEDWVTKPNTLPYILEHTEKFREPHGDYFIVYDRSTIVGMGGVCHSSFNNKIAIAGVRTWINPQYRNKSIARNYLLPEHKAWAINQVCKQVALTFNDYNKNIIAIWKRTRLGEKRTVRESRHMFYNNFNELEFPVIIQKTPQWVIYEKLDPDWQFNWQCISRQ